MTNEERGGEGRSDSLEGKGAAVQLLGSAETGLLGWRAAQQQELVGGVHELQLLSRCRRGRGQKRQRERVNRHIT